MAITQKDWQLEQERVTSVAGKISKQTETIESMANQIKEDVIHIRKHFWDEVSVNVGSADDLVETHFSIRQQAEVLSERERRYRYSFKTLHALTRLKDSPYFGRVDFQETETSETEQVYLGIASFQDKDGTFLVYDWRAPISSLYYDFGPGPVSYKAPLGNITGTMSLKRQYGIRYGNIQYMFDTGITIGDELLMQVLSRHSDAQMKSIVATIQREQNQIIRDDLSRMLIVEGVAGSGKTSAALQRVAYLLYKYRETLHADEMILFSPNPLFNSYVSTVLPELGEENMQQTTFHEYLEHRLGKQFKLEDPFDQLEYILTAKDAVAAYAARMSGIRYKSSVNYLHAIVAYKDMLEQKGMIFKPLKFRGKVIVSSKYMADHFYKTEAANPLASRIESMRRWLLEELSTFSETLLKEEWVEEEIDLLEPDDYQRAYTMMHKGRKGKQATFDDYDKEKAFLSNMVVQRRLKPIRNWVKRLRFVDIRSIYTQMYKNIQFRDQIFTSQSTDSQWSLVCTQTVEKLENSELFFEDATPFLYLMELIQGIRSNNTVRHVIVDEAQDYTPFQFQFLKNLFPRAKMTALGDLNQAIYAHTAALSDFDTITSVYGVNETQKIRLKRSYRSTYEIVEFTRGLIPGGNEIIPFNRHGEKPAVSQTGNVLEMTEKLLADIVDLKANGYESIAVICKTADEAESAHQALSQQLKVKLIQKDTPIFCKGIVVIPSYLAKGVEFDVVLIYNGSEERYCHERERKLFYTACTRAMHLLHIYTVGSVSPFVKSLQPDTYTFSNVFS